MRTSFPSCSSTSEAGPGESGTDLALVLHMNGLRHCEYVPAMPESDARRLRGLPACWGQPVAESALEALQRRAEAVATGLERAGRKREASALRRRSAMLARADELHRHASDVETIVGLYRALSVLAGENELVGEDQRTWAQAGMLDEPTAVAHGPAFRETAALRNRAYRSLAAAVAEYARGQLASNVRHPGS